MLVLLLSSEVWALGLGDIRMESALNEPLSARIELLSATPEELDNLRKFIEGAGGPDRYIDEEEENIGSLHENFTNPTQPEKDFDLHEELYIDDLQELMYTPDLSNSFHLWTPPSFRCCSLLPTHSVT